MKTSALTILVFIIITIMGLIFILPDGSLSIGEVLILSVVLIIGILVSIKIGE